MFFVVVFVVGILHLWELCMVEEGFHGFGLEWEEQEQEWKG